MGTTTRGTFPTGVVLHADRGTQVTSQQLAAYMRAATGTVSMRQAAVCRDNAMAQSLWATLTTEYYYRRAVTIGDIPHRRQTTPSGLDNSRINKPSTTCAQAQCHHCRSSTQSAHYTTNYTQTSFILPTTRPGLSTGTNPLRYPG